MSDAESQARRDAAELERDLNKLVGDYTLPNTFVAGLRKRAAERLVTWGWTHIGPGEQVIRRPTPRNEELSLRDELTGTLIEFNEKDPVALAGYLVGDGWVKRNEDEFVISKEEMLLLVAAKSAFQRWERLKNTVREGAEVSRDESQLTSGVKSADPEKLILAAFARSAFALRREEACDKAAATNVDSVGGSWDRWRTAFESLLERKLIEKLDDVEKAGEPLYILTQAGRGLHELDGVDR